MSRYPKPFPPPWASAFGDDVFGLWAELCFNGVSQRLRWIEAGEFLMGSPEGESKWGDERPQHWVRISVGYWLADTACTQDFWLAIVGGANPSMFRGDLNLPVENVSWNDIMHRFVPMLQAAIGDCVQVQLPSESQWEYACRARTTSAFSFGDIVTPGQVNYDGNYPFGTAAKGEFRGKTVPVASLPANPWGLYEMHGNVWEWCRDSMRDFGSKPELDPEGRQGVRLFNALRGGSWYRGAGEARSAYRFRAGPSSRSSLFGFRWCLRQIRTET